MKHLHKKICILLLAFIVLCSNCIIVSANSSLQSHEGFTTTVVISTNDKNFKKGDEVVFEVNITEQTKLPKLYTFAAKIVFNSNQLKIKELRSSKGAFTGNNGHIPTQEYNYVYGILAPSTPPTIGIVNEIVFEALQDHKDMGSVTVGESAKVAIAGIVSGTKKTSDPIYTYTAMVASAFESYVNVTPVSGTTQFQITGLGLKNSKNTKVPITFTCDQNGKKIKFYVIVKK